MENKVILICGFILVLGIIVGDDFESFFPRLLVKLVLPIVLVVEQVVDDGIERTPSIYYSRPFPLNWLAVTFHHKVGGRTVRTRSRFSPSNHVALFFCRSHFCHRRLGITILLGNAKSVCKRVLKHCTATYLARLHSS